MVAEIKAEEEEKTDHWMEKPRFQRRIEKSIVEWRGILTSVGPLRKGGSFGRLNDMCNMLQRGMVTNGT